MDGSMPRQPKGTFSQLDLFAYVIITTQGKKKCPYSPCRAGGHFFIAEL